MADNVSLKVVVTQKSRRTKRGRTSRNRRSKQQSKRPRVLLDTEYINLLKWAKRNGVVLNHIRPAIFHDTGRGMVANKNIKNGEVIISVPSKLLITPQTAAKSVIGEICDRIRTKSNVKLSRKVILCIFLEYLRFLGNDCFWYPYIKTLPSEFNTPAYFNDDELQFLPKSCHNASMAQIDELRQAFDCVNKLFSGTCCKGIDQRFLNNFTFDSFRWAWFVINTRSVYLDHSKNYYGDGCHGDDNLALAPILDMLNHNDVAEMHAGVDDITKTYKITTVTEYIRGRQVFINYGPHDNKTLLIEYGFILSKNVHNSIKIDPLHVYSYIKPPYSTNLAKKIEIIRKNNLEKDFTFNYENGVSWNLLSALRILSLNDNEIALWKQVFNGNINTEKEALISEWIDMVVFYELEMMVKDENSLKLKSNSTENISMALELRKQEKHILQSVLERQDK